MLEANKKLSSGPSDKGILDIESIEIEEDLENVRENEISYKKYSDIKRWSALTVFTLSSFAENLNGNLFTAVHKLLEAEWGVTTNQINLLSQIALFIPFLIIFIAMYSAERIAFEKSYYIAIIGNFISCLLRYVLPHGGSTGYNIALGTQVIISITHPFILVLPAKLSQEYFPLRLRVLATTIAVIFGEFGLGGGLIFMPIYSTNISKMYLFHMIVTAIPFLLSLFVFDLRKCFTCSRVKKNTKKENEKPYFHIYFNMVKHFGFLRLLLATFLCIGTSNTIIIVLPYVAGSSFNDINSISLLGLTFFLSGLIGGIFTSFFTKLYPNDPIKILRILSFLSMTFMIVMSIGWFYDNASTVYCGISGCAFFGFGLLPLGIEIGIEYIFDKYFFNPEATIAGIFQTISKVFSVFLIYVCTPNNLILDDKKNRIPFIWAGLCAFALFLIFTIPKDYNRQKLLNGE